MLTFENNCIFSYKEVEVNFQNIVMELKSELKTVNFSNGELQELIKKYSGKTVSIKSNIEKLEIVNHDNFKNMGYEMKDLHEDVLELDDHMYIPHHHVCYYIYITDIDSRGPNTPTM